jgi:oligoribonuclease NrnB/cAMP/cGMP phosphodiesterase (DHH superfamily)
MNISKELNSQSHTPHDSNTLVIYHANCTDGFGAAYAAWKKFGDGAQYLPMAFGDELPNVTDKNVYIVDFSFSREVYLEMLKTAKIVTLLDHHKRAFQNIGDCPGCYFDLSKSGAVLAWEFFHPLTPVPQFMLYIQDGDLLKFQLPETKAFYRGIHVIPHEFKDWENFENPFYLNSLVEEGKILEKFFQSQVRQIAKNAKPVTLMGKHGLMVNATYIFATEVGELLAKQCGSYGLVWYEELHHIKCSLRSVANFDSSEIAVHFNGGGHPQACAFTVPNLITFSQLIHNENNASYHINNNKTQMLKHK